MEKEIENNRRELGRGIEKKEWERNWGGRGEEDQEERRELGRGIEIERMGEKLGRRKEKRIRKNRIELGRGIN